MNQYPAGYPSLGPGLYYYGWYGNLVHLDVDPKLAIDLLPSPEREVLIALLRYALKRMKKATEQIGKPMATPPRASADPPSTDDLVNLVKMVERGMRLLGRQLP